MTAIHASSAIPSGRLRIRNGTPGTSFPTKRVLLKRVIRAPLNHSRGQKRGYVPAFSCFLCKKCLNSSTMTLHDGIGIATLASSPSICTFAKVSRFADLAKASVLGNLTNPEELMATATKKAATPAAKKAPATVKKAAAPAAKKAAVASPLKPIKDSFTKASLALHLAERAGVEPKTAKALMAALEETVLASVHKKGAKEFTLPGLLKVVAQDVPAKKRRFGKDPFSGEDKWFAAKPASVRLKVRPLKKLKDAAL